MKSKILSLVLALTLVFSTAAVSFAGTTTAEANKLDLKVISNGKTAVSVGVDKNYKATIKLENDVVNQKSVTLDLTMTNVDSLGVEGTRHADFTFDTGMDPQERALTKYMPNLKEFKTATVNGSINGYEFVYNIEGEATGAEGEATGEWTATPGDVEATRAAWHELASYVETKTYESDDSQVFLPNAGYIQIGTELLCFEDGSEGLTLNNLNDKATLEDKIRANVKLVEAEATDDMVVFVPAGTMLRVGSSEAKAIEDTTIRVNAEGSLVKGTPLANMRDAEGMYGVVQEALFIVDDVLGAMDGETINVEITTADYEKLQEDIAKAEDAIKGLGNVDINDKAAVEAARVAFNALPDEVKAEMPAVENTLLKAEMAIAKEEKEAGDKAAAEEYAKIKAALGMTKMAAKNVKVAVSKSGDLNVTWDAVTGADSYKVKVYKNNKLYKAVDTKKAKYALSNVYRGVVYTAVVIPSTTYQDEVYTGKEAKAAVTSKLSKANISVKKSGKYSVIKSADQNSTGFQVYISKDKKFKKGVKKVYLNTSGKALNKKLMTTKYFKKGKNYIKVRAYSSYNGKKIYGSWSEVKSVKR